MIYLLHGPNTFEIERTLRGLLAALAKKHPDSSPERLDGAEIDVSDLPDIMQGANLFTDHRIVVLRSASTNKAVWSALEDYIDRTTDTTDVIIVDPAVDKRTRTFKALQKQAQAQEFAEFGPRNQSGLQKWLSEEAKRRGVELPRESAMLLIERAGYDQWALANALAKLALVNDASPERVRELIEPSPNTNVFDLFEAALKGDAEKVRTMLSDLRQTNDPHALVGLLASQTYALALTAYSHESPDALGALTGSSPYPYKNMQPIARRLTKAHVQRVVTAMTACDRDLKRSVAPPWTLITRALLKVAALTS